MMPVQHTRKAPGLLAMPSRLLGYGALLLWLAACAGTPPPSLDEPPPASPEGLFEGAAPDPQQIDRTLDDLISRARNMPSPEAERLYLQAATYLAEAGRPVDAASLLDTISLPALRMPLAAEFIALRADLHLDAGQGDAAAALLTDNRLNDSSQLPEALQRKLSLLRADAFLATNQYLNSARERITASQWLPDEARRENHEKIWSALTALPVEQLDTLARTSISQDFKGWFELAMIGKAYQNNLDRQQVELARWQRNWGRHPASSQLPDAMQWVERLAAERPQHIALLLPLQTAAGAVIRDSFMSAYFNLKEIGGNVPQVRLYDTTDTRDIIALHRQAQQEGAEVIIGPLQKSHVEVLLNNPEIRVPTLALNYVEGQQPRSPQVYQFALSPEDEARQVARRAWEDGHRHVAILSPFDNAGDDFYQRKRQSFINEWRALGGRVASQALFSDEYTGVIRNLLDIDDSQARHEALSSLIRRPTTFVERRRQDIDFIFLIAPPLSARQIKPSLAYLFAGDLPVYATQDIHGGNPNPQQDRDLNGILFSESPWLLPLEDELKSSMLTLFPQNNGLYLRLQAFGIDAFRLYPRLRQLEQEGGNNFIYGASGVLHMPEQQRIVRELSWARMEGGRAVPLDTPR